MFIMIIMGIVSFAMSYYFFQYLLKKDYSIAAIFFFLFLLNFLGFYRRVDEFILYKNQNIVTELQTVSNDKIFLYQNKYYDNYESFEKAINLSNHKDEIKIINGNGKLVMLSSEQELIKGYVKENIDKEEKQFLNE